MDGADESNSSPATANTDEGILPSKEEEKVLPKQQEANSDVKKSSTGNEETMDDSPIMGVLTPKSEVYFSVFSKISLGGVGRLLEEDLGLDKNTLDAYKNFISQQVDQVLKGAKSVKDTKKKRSEDVKSRKSEKVNSEDSDASLSDKVKLRKEGALRRNIKKFEQPRKRRNSKNVDMDNNSDEGGSISEDDQSQWSTEKSAPHKKEENNDKDHNDDEKVEEKKKEEKEEEKGEMMEENAEEEEEDDGDDEEEDDADESEEFDEDDNEESD